MHFHEQVHNRAVQKAANPSSWSTEEMVTYRAYSLHSYIECDGLDGGIANLEPGVARLSLPALKTLGLTELADELARFLDYFEWVECETPEQTDAHFAFCDQTLRKLEELGLNDIPRILEAHLQQQRLN